MTRVTMIGPAVEERLLSAFESVKETVEEFTDSYYTSHEAREKIVQLSDCLRDDLQNMLLLGQNLVCFFYVCVFTTMIVFMWYIFCMFCVFIFTTIVIIKCHASWYLL